MLEVLKMFYKFISTPSFLRLKTYSFCYLINDQDKVSREKSIAEKEDLVGQMDFDSQWKNLRSLSYPKKISYNAKKQSTL